MVVSHVRFVDMSESALQQNVFQHDAKSRKQLRID